MAAAMFAGQVVCAQPLVVSPQSIHGMFKAKLVNFRVTNDTGAPLIVKAGKNTLVLEPGKTTDFVLASGDEIVTKTRTKHYDQGQVLVHVNADLEGHTITIE